ncbi:MAG TPA: type II CAAX endopeptidase family protein [Rubrobacter sp.]|nr:type II CAAX endopeptidase family protein [Rubrobacter sp.]
MKGRAGPQTATGAAKRDPASQGPPCERQTEQYSLAKILAAWAAAALPMAALAWVIAPLVAGRLGGLVPLARALLALLTLGLMWQFVLVVLLVYRERGSLRWPVLKDALWISAPRSPTTGRVGGRLWLVLIPATLLFAAEEFVPTLPPVAGHDFAVLVGSEAGREFFSGNWVWFALIAVLAVFNTVLGEELLFRGLLLPRMKGAFGRWDWVANGVLFAFYHLHMPWAIPASLVDTFALAYPSRRYQSALIGIIVHSSQSIFFLALLLAIVLR